MFRILLKDLRISPIRTFLTGFSMFIGIIAMIAAVLVGTLGRESLLSVNAQLFDGAFPDRGELSGRLFPRYLERW